MRYAEMLAMADAVAERNRKLALRTIRPIGHEGRLQRIKDNDAEFISLKGMLAELLEDSADSLPR
jgi:starvation-inducible DNA-binding protein